MLVGEGNQDKRGEKNLRDYREVVFKKYLQEYEVVALAH